MNRACSTPFNSGLQQVDPAHDRLIPLIFRENHPRESGEGRRGSLILINGKMTPGVSLERGLVFPSGGENPLINLCLRCLASPRDIFVSGYLLPRLCVERINIQVAVERGRMARSPCINQSLRSTQSRATCSTD